MTDVPQFEVFTGSASKKKTGHGGYAAIVKSGKRQMELAGGFHLTSAERMELMASIVGLETLPAPCQVFVYSNLVYSVDQRVKRLAKTWDENYWTLSDAYAGPSKGHEGENEDLWERLLTLCSRLSVVFEWRQGHGGQNEIHRCEALANEWAQQTLLPQDEGYHR